MRKALGVVVVACAAALMGAQFNQVQIQLIVADALRGQKFESLGAPAPGAPERFKVSEGTMVHLRRLQIEGKVLEVDAAGIVRFR